jgi:hypothetical protein
MAQASDASDIYRRQGVGFASGFGARPALLTVDFVNGFNDPLAPRRDRVAGTR